MEVGDFFVFGTLMYPEILLKLLGTVPAMKNATLYGYRRAKIDLAEREAKGPAIVASPNQKVEGKILLGLTERQVRIIDLYEHTASGYQRVQGTAVLGDGSKVTVHLYQATDEVVPHLTDEDWSEAEFERKYLQMYVFERIPALLNAWNKAGQV